MLTGQPAYTGRSFEEVLRKARRGDVAEARGRLEASGADPALIALAKECLAPEPVDRPADAGAGRSRGRLSIRRARAAESRGPAAAAAEVRVVEERKRRFWQLGLAASSLGLIVLAGGILAYSRGSRQPGWRQRRAPSRRPWCGRPGPGPRHGFDGTCCRHPCLDRVLDEARRAEDAVRGGEAAIALKLRVAGRIADLEDRLAEARHRAATMRPSRSWSSGWRPSAASLVSTTIPHAATPTMRRSSATPGSTSTRPTPSKRVTGSSNGAGRPKLSPRWTTGA